MNLKLLSCGLKTCTILWLIMTALKAWKKRHSVCYVWVYKAVCVCGTFPVGGGGRLGGRHKQSQHVLAIDKKAWGKD